MARTERYCAAALALLISACQPAERPPARPGATPRVRATVVTIRTLLQPSNESSVHTIVIGPTTARDTSEAVRWRLFDHKQNRVAFIDDHHRSYRFSAMAALVAAPREQPAGEIAATGERRMVLGVAASKTVIRRGSYQRDVWLAEHPAVPSQLFAMMEASHDRPSWLLQARGFPLIDHTEVPYGKQRLIVDRTVVSIVARDVPAALLEIPKGYRDLTAPGADRRRASSPPRGRTVPAAESPPSATTRTTP